MSDVPHELPPLPGLLRSTRENDAAVEDAIAQSETDLARRVFMPDGSVQVFDERGNLVRVEPPLPE